MGYVIIRGSTTTLFIVISAKSLPNQHNHHSKSFFHNTSFLPFWKIFPRMFIKQNNIVEKVFENVEWVEFYKAPSTTLFCFSAIIKISKMSWNKTILHKRAFQNDDCVELRKFLSKIFSLRENISHEIEKDKRLFK